MTDYDYMMHAKLMSIKSHCVRLRVGCVIVKNGRIVSSGYNGSPSGLWNCDDLDPRLVEEVCTRDSGGGCLVSLHAEINAVTNAQSNGMSLVGARCYVTTSPCLHCVKVLYSAGIQSVVYQDDYEKYRPSGTGKDAKVFCSIVGIEIKQIS